MSFVLSILYFPQAPKKKMSPPLFLSQKLYRSHPRRSLPGTL